MRCFQVIAAVIMAVSFYTLIGTAEASEIACEELPDGSGGDHYMLIDGEIHFYTGLESSREMLSKLQILPLVEHQLELASTQVDRCHESIEIRDEAIATLEEEVAYQGELIERYQHKPDGLLASDEAHFLIGLVVGGAIVGTTVYLVK